MLISDSYRELNEKLHSTHRYGERGDKWAAKTRELITRYQPATLLDYGCGKGALKRALAPDISADIHEYDPAVPEKSAAPAPADLVICTDVLEHVEPNCIEDVVAHLKSLTRTALFLVVSTRPAVKHLEDGRNAHLIIQPLEDWMPLLSRDMLCVEQNIFGDEFSLLLSPTD